MIVADCIHMVFSDVNLLFPVKRWSLILYLLWYLGRSWNSFAQINWIKWHYAIFPKPLRRLAASAPRLLEQSPLKLICPTVGNRFIKRECVGFLVNNSTQAHRRSPAKADSHVSVPSWTFSLVYLSDEQLYLLRDCNCVKNKHKWGPPCWAQSILRHIRINCRFNPTSFKAVYYATMHNQNIHKDFLGIFSLIAPKYIWMALLSSALYKATYIRSPILKE